MFTSCLTSFTSPILRWVINVKETRSISKFFILHSSHLWLVLFRGQNARNISILFKLRPSTNLLLIEIHRDTVLWLVRMCSLMLEIHSSRHARKGSVIGASVSNIIIQSIIPHCQPQSYWYQFVTGKYLKTSDNLSPTKNISADPRYLSICNKELAKGKKCP